MGKIEDWVNGWYSEARSSQIHIMDLKETFHLSKHKVPFQLDKKKLEKYESISLNFGSLG